MDNSDSQANADVEPAYPFEDAPAARSFFEHSYGRRGGGPAARVAASFEDGYPESAAHSLTAQPPFEQAYAFDSAYPYEFGRVGAPADVVSPYRSVEIANGDHGIPPVPLPDEPLKMACIGPGFCIGGVRQHALSLAKFLNPRVVRITEFLVTDAVQLHDAGTAMPAPVTRCDMDSLQRVSRDCDVLLMWGEGFNGRIAGDGASRVFLAHGESAWTRTALVDSCEVVDHVIAVSERVRRAVCRGFPTTTILNGVDTARLGQTADRDEVRRRFAFTGDDFVVGSVGRMTREKQLHLLIEALANLPPHFKLLVVGSGRRQGELLDLANRCIPGRFAFVADNDYLGDYYNAMDAFGLVSAHEGFGLVLAEAMMCGRPVFATNVGCVTELIRDRINGVIVQPNAQAIAAAVAALHRNPHWAGGLAAQGQALAKSHLQAARMARDYERLLCRLVHDRRTAHCGAAR